MDNMFISSEFPLIHTSAAISTALTFGPSVTYGLLKREPYTLWYVSIDLILL